MGSIRNGLKKIIKGNQKLTEILDSLDNESIQGLMNTLSEDDRKVILDLKEDEPENPIYTSMVVSRFLMRALDINNGVTDMNDDGVLVLSGSSYFGELPLNVDEVLFGLESSHTTIAEFLVCVENTEEIIDRVLDDTTMELRLQ